MATKIEDTIPNISTIQPNIWKIVAAVLKIPYLRGCLGSFFAEATVAFAADATPVAAIGGAPLDVFAVPCVCCAI